MRWSPRHTDVRDRLQDRVPGQVLAAARLRPRSGTPASHAPCQLPTEGVWVAVSATRLDAFAARADGVGDLLEIWSRDATTVRRTARLTASHVALRIGANGNPVES